MPTLNEYLGGIFNSITTARAMSDAQTVEIAEQYAKHDLLKHFSVPRMRFSDIELTIPVAIDSLSARSELQLMPIGNEAFRGLVYRELVSFLNVKTLPAGFSQALSARIEPRTQELARNLRESYREDVFVAFAKSMVSDFETTAAEYGLNSSIDIDYGAIAERLMKISPEVIKSVVEKQSVDQLAVVAESYRLREQRPQDLIYIRMTVSEDGMEWQSIEKNDGAIERKLLPE